MGRWLRQPINEELYASCYRLLDVAEKNGVRLWLVDARHRQHATQQAVPWIMEQFFPQLSARVGGTVHMAHLFMPVHLYEIEQDANVPQVTYFDGRPYHVERFAGERAAMSWPQTI